MSDDVVLGLRDQASMVMEIRGAAGRACTASPLGAIVATVANGFCDRLGITPPRLLDVAIGPARSHLDALILVLLAKGEPLDLDEIVGVLAPMWAGTAADLRVTLQKAWAGRKPVIKGADGRFTLDLDSWRLRPILERLGLREPAAAPPGPPPFVQPGPEVPLTRVETDAAFRNCVPTTISGVRLAAAVLDVHGRPMTEAEILASIPETPLYRPPKPREGPRRATAGLVLRQQDGRLVLNRASPEVAIVRAKIRELAHSTLRRAADADHYRRLLEERQRAAVPRLAASPPTPPAPSKLAWRGTLTSVQPRIRLTRSFDQRSHSYLGYILRVRGDRGGEDEDFAVAIGKAVQGRHEFRVGDEVRGEGVRVEDRDLETADLYKVSSVRLGARGPAERSKAPPFLGVPPALEVYRARGHRRLAAVTYSAKCRGCLWGAEMAVEMIIDPWNPSKKRCRRETFCYGPRSCPIYAAGPTRKVPGRNGTSWTEEDWVDEDATAHRGDGE